MSAFSSVQDNSNNNSNRNSYIGKWKGTVGNEMISINIESTQQSKKLIGWYSFYNELEIKNLNSYENMFTNVKINGDVISFQDEMSNLLITGWIITGDHQMLVGKFSKDTKTYQCLLVKTK